MSKKIRAGTVTFAKRFCVRCMTGKKITCGNVNCDLYSVRMINLNERKACVYVNPNNRIPFRDSTTVI
jgi:hypothetical protein